jgi:hypothetical protein
MLVYSGQDLISSIGRDEILKRKLIDIGFYLVSMDIGNSFWTVILGHWMVEAIFLVNQLREQK